MFDDCVTRKRDEKNMYVRLDEKVCCADDVRRLGIRNGDYIFVDTKTEFTDSGFVKSRFLDDKAGAAELLTVLHVLKEEKILPEKQVKIFHSEAIIIANSICKFMKLFTKSLTLS